MSRTGALATLWALSDETRLDIVDRISAGTEVTVTQLAAVLPITRQAVRRHVDTLEQAGLLVGRKEGRELRYRADLRPLREAARWLERRTRSWERALQRLARHLAND